MNKDLILANPPAPSMVKDHTFALLILGPFLFFVCIISKMGVKFFILSRPFNVFCFVQSSHDDKRSLSCYVTVSVNV